MKIRKRPSVVERFFSATGSACWHCSSSPGKCRCSTCMNFMEQYGAVFGRYPGGCKECLGTTRALVKRDIPLDENGVPVERPPKTGQTGKVVGGSQPRRPERSSSRKPSGSVSGATAPNENAHHPKPGSTIGGVAALIASKGGSKKKKKK